MEFKFHKHLNIIIFSSFISLSLNCFSKQLTVQNNLDQEVKLTILGKKTASIIYLNKQESYNLSKVQNIEKVIFTICNKIKCFDYNFEKPKKLLKNSKSLAIIEKNTGNAEDRRKNPYKIHIEKSK